MINRNQSNKQMPINIVGSSTFGRYPKISVEKTYNMFISDNWLVPYGGYRAIIRNLGINGRAIFTSTVLDKMIVVMGSKVFSLNVIFNPTNPVQYTFNPVLIGTINTFTSDVYIAENNANQIAISDGSDLWIYNPTSATPFVKVAINFIPGYISFHDTYFLCASLGTPNWRLSLSNDGTSWPADAQHVGALETKPDNVVAVTRFPSRGNMIFVFGKNVTEPWFDQGLQLFPYTRSTAFNIDYGCLNPATIAATDEIIVWLAGNEKSGPIIMSSNGDMPEKITTDGIDYLLSTLTAPSDSEGFITRRDGHLLYHINFYTDNLSLFYDFNEKKFYHASDERYNYFIAKEVAFFNNQYYFVSKKNGNVYAFDTEYTTYDGEIIPRRRICRNVRLPTQEYFIGTDAGFTIEQGEMEAQREEFNPFNLITQDGKKLITEGNAIFLNTEDGQQLQTEDGFNLVSEQEDNDFAYLVTEQNDFTYVQPRVDFSFSIDGGETFSSYPPYELNPLGKRRNMLRWWQLGLANDFVCDFRFWGIGRFVATDGILNIRQ